MTVRVFDTSASAVQSRILDMKKKYPNGSRFDNYYPFSKPKPYKSNIKFPYDGNYGCAAFAAELSDYSYGSIRNSIYTDPSKIAVGDVILFKAKTIRRSNGTWFSFYDNHAAIVYKISGNNIWLAQGNFNSKADWNMYLTKAEMRTVFKKGSSRN